MRLNICCIKTVETRAYGKAIRSKIWKQQPIPGFKRWQPHVRQHFIQGAAGWAKHSRLIERFGLGKLLIRRTNAQRSGNKSKRLVQRKVERTIETVVYGVLLLDRCGPTGRRGPTGASAENESG